jgi:hypothetical protein
MTDKPKELRRLAAEAVRRYPSMNDAMSWLYRLIVSRTQFDDWRAALVEAEIRPLVEEALRSAPDAPSFTLSESARAAARGHCENEPALAR